MFPIPNDKQLVILRREPFSRDSAVISQALATTQQEVIFDGFKRAGLVAVRVTAICTDRGEVTDGAAINTIRFKARGDQQDGIFGGSRWHTFASQPAINRNRVDFDGWLYPGEDQVLDWMNGTAAKNVFATQEGELIFGYYVDLAPAKKSA